MMTYKESLTFLDSFINYERGPSRLLKKEFKLERVKAFLSSLSDPQKAFRIIQVAGTKGKGSTSCFIAHILKEANFRVGLYTSPHLKSVRERIRILDPKLSSDEHNIFSGMILKNDFAKLIQKLKSKIEDFHRDSRGWGELTFFEILTVLAFLFFKEKGVDFVVLETGLGGRHDATNVGDAEVCVFTPISYDHEKVLGHTLTEIAFEKAGIIKKTNVRTASGVALAVSGKQGKEASKVLRRRAKLQEVMLFEGGKDFRFKKISGDLFTQEFFYQGLNNEGIFLKTRLLGTHQIENAALALAACEALRLHGIPISREAKEKGVLEAYWPGRLEVIRTKPFVILDGAHNRDSALRLSSFLGREFKKYRKWLVFGASDDKDIKGIVEELESFADRIILTSASHPRAADPLKMLKPAFRKDVSRVTKNVEEALDLLNKEMTPDDVAVITGSLFLVGEARSLWQR